MPDIGEDSSYKTAGASAWQQELSKMSELKVFLVTEPRRLVVFGDAIPDDNSDNYEMTAAVASFFAASRKLDSWEKAKAQGALESMGGYIVEQTMKHCPEPTVGANFFEHSVKKFTAESKEYRGWYSEVIGGDPPALGV